MLALLLLLLPLLLLLLPLLLLLAWCDNDAWIIDKCCCCCCCCGWSFFEDTIDRFEANV
jgi:hypothetical protein